MRMRSNYSNGLALACLVSLVISPLRDCMAGPDDTRQGREEIIVTPRPSAPADDWNQMRAHKAEYDRLKEKYDPSPRFSHTDALVETQVLAAPLTGHSTPIDDHVSPEVEKAIRGVVAPE